MGAVALAVPLSLGLAHVANAAAPAPAIKLAQNSSDDITPLEGIACNGGTVLATDYYRRFDLSGYGAANGLTVSSISFGVEQADSTDGTIPGSVAVYAIDHAATLTVANLGTALTTVPVNIDTVANGAILTAPITGTVPAGKDLVIKASVESAATDEVFFMGANTASETKDAYLAAPDCGASAPTSLGDLGLPGTSLVFFAHGKTTDCLTAEGAVTKAEAALAAAKASVTAAQAAVTKATADVAAATKSVKKAKAKLKKAKKSGDAKKIKKAKAKVKKAKGKLKSAKTALASANTALASANTAATSAQGALTAATTGAASKCAQPALPGSRPTSGNSTKPASTNGHSFTHSS